MYKSGFIGNLILSLVLTFRSGSDMLADSSVLNRVISPDSLLDAVYVQYEGGGETVDYSYGFYVLPKGGQLQEEDLVFDGEK